MPINFCSEIQTSLQNVLLFLLKRKDVPKLSDQQRVVKDALVPFPLYNCVHVKTDVPAKEFGGKCSDSWTFNFFLVPKAYVTRHYRKSI